MIALVPPFGIRRTRKPEPCGLGDLGDEVCERCREMVSG